MRALGAVPAGSVKVSRFTSRQLLQAEEMDLNSDSIQSAAALTPVLGARSVSMLERVLRLLKETSLVMVALMWSGETCARAAAMAGSAGAAVMGRPVVRGCWVCWAWRIVQGGTAVVGGEGGGG